jgi:hypothetical protein
MNDRVPTYPGRVKLVPVTGQENTYDMVMADEPTQEGTPPTKANLLSDATAAKLGGVETPNAAFDLLSRFHAGLGNEYVWSKNQYSVNLGDITSSSGVTIISWVSGSSNKITYANSALDLMQGNGIDVISSSFASADAMKAFLQTVLPNKYYYDSSHTGRVCFAPQEISFSISYSSNIEVTPYQYYSNAIIVKTLFGYVNSPSSDAYPPAVSDGYTYTPLGRIGNRARISSVSYTGTGVSGASNPTVLSADFNVKIAIIIQKTSKANHAIIVDTTGFYLQSGNSQPYMLTAISHTDGISFYSAATAEQQCNFSGYVYEAILIG